MNWDIYKQLADLWYEGYKHKLYIQQQPDYTKYDGAECFELSKGKIGVVAFVKQVGAE